MKKEKRRWEKISGEGRGREERIDRERREERIEENSQYVLFHIYKMFISIQLFLIRITRLF